MKTDAIDTIAAISTPVGFGGIGIVRISGSGSIDIARKIFRQSPPTVNSRIKIRTEPEDMAVVPRRLHYGYIFDSCKPSDFSEVLMVYMPAPKSYTCEDVIEIQAHGGTATLKAILEIVLKNGARLADPGEFTRRAYLNGRIDLSQAEAIIDVIQAKTAASLRIANRNLEGDVGKSVQEIRESLLEIKVMMEARIDFPEDVDEILDTKELREKISRVLLEPINYIIEGYRHGHLLREGVRLVIFGRSNVGKSSLLNRFLKRERAIVTPYPGTTRDSLEESIDLLGLPTVVVDTAGFRRTTDPVEKVGIERALDLAKKANIILFMVDAETGIVAEDDDIYQCIQKNEKILVINKTDLLDVQSSISIPKKWSFAEVVYTSAKFGYGFEELREKLYKRLMSGGSASEGVVVPNLRQKNLFMRAQRVLENALKEMTEHAQPELIAIDIQAAMDILDEISGTTVKADVLDQIFSRFCVGK